MDNLLKELGKTSAHLAALHATFLREDNFQDADDLIDFELYREHLSGFNESFSAINAFAELYSEKNRQMVLADLIEYLVFGRAIYSISNRSNRDPSVSRGRFIAGILHLVNLLMSYESITVNSNLRGRYIEELIKSVPSVGNEVLMQELMGYNGPIGIPNSGAPKPLEKYFDKLLPKTAGGLWHEMLVFIFLLRKDYGYVVPLLLSQRLYSLKAHLVPPDFLILTHDKRLYGIEVGMKKEIQSGSFSLRTAIPTATLDTINSRNSDRCPKCKKWILFCPYVISKYSDMNAKLEETEVNCLSKCTVYTREQILNGECKYTKYSRKYAKTLVHTHHDFADGLHYHYHCVLSSVDDSMHALLKAGEDVHSLKTHFPYYSGLEGLHGARIENGDVEENESDSSDLSL